MCSTEVRVLLNNYELGKLLLKKRILMSLNLMLNLTTFHKLLFPSILLVVTKVKTLTFIIHSAYLYVISKFTTDMEFCNNNM